MRSTYRRNASGDYLCKEWGVAIMLAEQRPKLAMDAEILEGYTLDDIDKESLRGFRQLFMNMKPTHPWTEDDDLTLLKHVNAYGKDRVSGKEGLTLVGLLMFGKYNAITDAMPQFMIDYREYTRQRALERQDIQRRYMGVESLSGLPENSAQGAVVPACSI